MAKNYEKMNEEQIETYYPLKLYQLSLLLSYPSSPEFVKISV